MRPTLMPIDRSTAPARACPAAAPVAMSRHARRFLLLSVSLLVAACSSLQLGYNNADTLLAYSLDSYLKLDDEQQRLARGRIDALHRWHRSTQLAGYAQLLADARGRIAGPVSAADVAEFSGRVRHRLAAIGEQAAPDLAQLALTLQPAQIERLAQRLDRDASKSRRALVRLAGPESLEQRLERAVERAEDWFGTVTPAQRELIRERLSRRPDAHEAWQQERERRGRDLVALLERIRAEQPPLAQASAWMREYLAELAEPRDAERRLRLAQFRAENAELIAALLNSASPAQRAALSRKLGGYAADLEALAARGGAADRG